MLLVIAAGLLVGRRWDKPGQAHEGRRQGERALRWAAAHRSAQDRQALLLLATSYGLYRLLNPNLVEHLQDWLTTLTEPLSVASCNGPGLAECPGNARIGGILLVTSLYTGVLLTEGIGLWLRKTWRNG